MVKASHKDKKLQKERMALWSVELLEGDFPCPVSLSTATTCSCRILNTSKVISWAPSLNCLHIFSWTPLFLCALTYPFNKLFSSGHSFFCECEAPHVKTISELFGMGELTSRHDGMNLLCDHSLSWRKDASLSLPTINFCTMFNICIIILQ